MGKKVPNKVEFTAIALPSFDTSRSLAPLSPRFFHFNCSPNFANKNQVSPDVAIALAFGLISTMIGLLGLFIGYLTLRAMTLEISMPHLFTLPSSHTA
jgi:hypothetical protein